MTGIICTLLVKFGDCVGHSIRTVTDPVSSNKTFEVLLISLHKKPVQCSMNLCVYFHLRSRQSDMSHTYNYPNLPAIMVLNLFRFTDQ